MQTLDPMHTEADEVFRDVKVRYRQLDARRAARGKTARAAVGRSRQAELALRDRPDPIALLEAQAQARVPELVPIRHGRMMASPFAFFRGAALVMASDLAQTPNTGLAVQVCGDAHLLNFGLFGTPERSLVFDVNDFDETLPGPWEWDLKRLAASLEIAGRNNGFAKDARRSVVQETVRCYRETMAALALKGNLEVWYARLNIDAVMDEVCKMLTRRERKASEKAIVKAHQQDSAHALDKLAQLVDGVRRLISRPPLIVPMGELLGEAECAAFHAEIQKVLHSYSQSLQSDRRALFEQYHLVELARKVVGVGSVGTRCWIALFLGEADDDPLFLQVKEAEASVLERFVGPSRYDNHGERVVAGQRLMQTASDLLLGWARSSGIDGVPRDFYFRQLRDWKGAFVIDEMVPDGMALYGRLCGWTLARAHARSGDRVAIAGYLGRSDRFDQAIARFADAYAEQNEQDHEALLRAIRSGRLAAEAGV
jgi:uncharacterized protein (DUF2252 family)